MRGWLIRKLAGTGEAPAEPPPAPPIFVPNQPPAAPAYPVAPQPSAPTYPAPPQYGGYPAAQAAAPQPGVYYPPLPVPERWPAPQPGYESAPGFAPSPAPRPVAPPPAPGPPAGTAEFYPGAGDDDGKTRFIGGVDLAKLKIPKYTYTLQILDTSGQWRDWGPVHAGGMNVGRAKNSADFPGLSSMAVRHLRLSYDKAGLVVEDLGSLNGVYLRLLQPVELIDGMRFRVGSQTIEFHQAEPFEAAPAQAGDDGEEYCSRDLEPLAFLDMIRPNGKPGLRFPITKLDTTVIGREGPNSTIALTGDNSVSASHAQVRHDAGRFFLEDLKSRNSTFVHVLGSSPLKSGDVILAGRVLFRVVDHSGGV